jgi:hypothetical protein
MMINSLKLRKNWFNAVSRHSGESRNPVWLGVTDTLDPGFHRGDKYRVIFSHLPSHQGREGFGVYVFRCLVLGLLK